MKFGRALGLLLVLTMLFSVGGVALADTESGGSQDLGAVVMDDQSSSDVQTDTTVNDEGTADEDEDEDEDAVDNGDIGEPGDGSLNPVKEKKPFRGKGKAFGRFADEKGLAIARQVASGHGREVVDFLYTKRLGDEDALKLLAISLLTDRDTEDLLEELENGEGIDELAESLGLDPDEVEEAAEEAEEGVIEEELEEELDEDVEEDLDLEDDQNTSAESAERVAALERQTLRLRERLAGDPTDIKAKVRLANALRKLGRIEEALAVAEEAVGFDPADKQALVALARTLAADGRREEAINLMERAAEIARDKNTLAFLALLKEELGDDGVAVGMLEEVLQADPKDRKLYKKLGQLYRKLRQRGEQVPDIPVFVQGMKPDFDVPPIIENGRTLVPFRAISEALGAEVSWDPATRTVTVAKDDIVVKLTVDSIEATVNGKTVQLDVPAVVRSNRTLVPLRFLSEALGAYPEWDPEYNMIVIL